MKILEKEFHKNIKYQELTIQIIPMSKDEFEGMSIEEVQTNYFMNELINRNECLYYYRSKGIKNQKNTMLLFQYDNHIVASAILKQTLHFDKPIEGGYKGAWELEKDSIQIFIPITCDELRLIVPKIKKFSQAKQVIDSVYSNKILHLIEIKKLPVIAEEIAIGKSIGLVEGAKIQIYVNAYERNTIARDKCIEHYKKKDRGKLKCQICDFCFEDFYGEEFKEKIHVHHIKALAEIDEEYEVDPIRDLLPVCPNCHLAIHSKDDAYCIEALKEKIGK